MVIFPIKYSIYLSILLSLYNETKNIDVALIMFLQSIYATFAVFVELKFSIFTILNNYEIVMAISIGILLTIVQYLSIISIRVINITNYTVLNLN